MPKLLIVEDETAAGRYLRSLVERKCPDFSVIGIARNGREALEQVGLLKPDLVITDVKMPVMDGIELVTELKKSFPLLPSVIVSGHQEFEYARRALDTGVVDYLLKPVDPVRLVEVLDRLGSQLSLREGLRRAESLERLVNGHACAEAGTSAPGELFWLAIVRAGGLPSRFRFDQAGAHQAASRDGLYVLPGRDAREQIFLGHTAHIPSKAFEAAVRTAADQAALPCTTVLIRSAASSACQLREAARNACLDVDRLLVAGMSQVHCGPVVQVPEARWDETLADAIEFALRESRVCALERAVRAIADTWRTGRVPLVAVESHLRRVLHFVLRKAPHASEEVAANLEFFLEDALAASQDFDQLSDSAWSLVARAAGVENFESRGQDVPVFFHSIMRYVEARYSEPLTLRSLSETFRISSSYLSKLFRQHAGRSLGEFLESIRIEAAKRLIREAPGMPLKDVSERVGYSDPFYFSRVFKSVAGLPPSEYSRQGKEEAPLSAE